VQVVSVIGIVILVLRKLWQLGSASVEEEQRPQQKRRLSKYVVPPSRKTFGSKIMTLYHVTDAGPEIERRGEMRRGSGGLVGGGIYFAETAEVCMRKALSHGYLVTAHVHIGNVKHVDVSLSNLFILIGPVGVGGLLNPLLPVNLQVQLAALLVMASFTGPAAMVIIHLLVAWLYAQAASIQAQYRDGAVNAVLGLNIHARENETFAKLQSEGYDSVKVLGMKTGIEYVVYNKDQVELVEVTYRRW